MAMQRTTALQNPNQEGSQEDSGELRSPAGAALPCWIRLSAREWLLAVLLSAAALYLLPMLWPGMGTHFSRPDYRLPGELSSDYWMFRKWCQYTHARHEAVVLGDSVVWGQYVKSTDTLAAHLNELAGTRVFANLGVDGLHPAAMAGMISYYGDGVAGEPVILHLNPLWMSSPQQDLQRRGEERFNQPSLVAQVFHRPPASHPPAAEVIGTVLERHVPFLSWKQHIKLAFCEGMSLPEWTLENPYRVLSVSRGPDRLSGDEPGSEPRTWQDRGIEPANLPWVETARSYQWASFTRVVALLRSRGNDVFVLLGPFNTHALTPESERHYRALQSAMEEWLVREKIPYCAPPPLPSGLYADASHPLGDGYRMLAEELGKSPPFEAWVKTWAGEAGWPGQLHTRTHRTQ
jgi:hypothetical protein